MLVPFIHQGPARCHHDALPYVAVARELIQRVLTRQSAESAQRTTIHSQYDSCVRKPGDIKNAELVFLALRATLRPLTRLAVAMLLHERSRRQGPNWPSGSRRRKSLYAAHKPRAS